MIKILKHLKLREWIQIGICLIFISLQVFLDLELPQYTKKITHIVQTSGELSQIWINGAYMMLCALCSLATAIVVSLFASRISSALSFRLRGQIYNKVGSFSMEEIGKFSTSSLITRSTNDISQIQMLVAMGIQVLIKAPILSIWSIIKIAGKSWQWSVTTACAVFIMVVLLSVIILFALPKFKTIQKLTDNLNSVTRENLTGVRVVRAYNAEDYQENKFDDANKKLTRTHLFTSRIMGIMSPGISLIMNGLSLAIYWLGAYLINGSLLSARPELLEDMIVYSYYAIQVVMSFMMIVFFCIMLPRASVSAGRINDVLGTKTKIIDGEIENSPLSNGEVEFKNVSFKYPDASDYVLHNVSFKAESGETVAFIGSTGSGKSTLINLIPRFYDATEGEILIDGVNVRDYKLNALRGKIGYISQRAVIFSGDINSNVDFGENGKKDLKHSDIENAVTIAQAKDFIEKMPEKYNSPIAQRGTNLSGGQKQRLAIARAIARKPEIYIFDDSFSALDYKTDKKLRKELTKVSKDSTTFIVAQRIGTIRNADKIVVLESGNVVGIGKHNELIKNCEVYREIANSQLSKEEI